MTFSTRDFFDHNIKATGSGNLNIIRPNPISHKFGLRVDSKLAISILTPNKDFCVLKKGGLGLNILSQCLLIRFSPWIFLKPWVNPWIRLDLLLTRVWVGCLPKLRRADIVQISFRLSDRNQVVILLTAEIDFEIRGLDMACLVCEHVLFAPLHVLSLNWV